MSGGSLRARGGACSVLDRITHAHPTRASFRAPRAKIRRAKHKLECANPCSVMLQELSENRTVAKLQGYFPAVRAMWLDGPPTTLPRCVITMVCVAAWLFMWCVYVCEQLADAVQGPADCVRRAPENNMGGWRCKNVEAQVECLVELATDPNVLGRQYVGLAPWL